ncbi:MAG: hypothetical protein MK135_13255 [Polyangiaceae bacterium]|nr:hypothetical protein [Polyangiaceae bacterium]
MPTLRGVRVFIGALFGFLVGMPCAGLVGGIVGRKSAAFVEHTERRALESVQEVMDRLELSD